MLNRHGRVGRIAGWSAVDIRLLRGRDRVWRHVPVTKVVRSIRTPDAETVRARLRQCAHQYSGDIRWRLLDIDQGVSGCPSADCAEQFFRALVVSSADASPSKFAVRDDGVESDQLDGLPFRLTLGHDWAAIRYSHALGDAVSTWSFLGFLLDTGVASFPEDGRAVFAPVPRALLKSFGGSPFRLAAAVRVQRELAPRVHRPVAGTYSAPAGGDAHHFEVVAATSDEGFLDRMRAERNRRHPAASIMSILSVRAIALCQSQGLVVDPRMVMMIDMRRYLPARAVVDGNFSWSKSVPAPYSNTPTELTEWVSKILDSGLPLLIFFHELWRRQGKHAAMMPRRSDTAESTTVRLMMSYGSKWLDPPTRISNGGPPHILVYIPPPGPDFIGINIVESGGCVHVSVNYRDDILNRESADLIARGLVAEPDLAPLDGSSTARHG